MGFWQRVSGNSCNRFVAFEKIAQQKIQEAVEAGEFDNLPNAGQKLDLEHARLRLNVAVDRMRADSRPT